MAFRVGMTEHGDAGRNLAWTETIKSVNCAILITKSITKDFANAVLSCPKPVIIHCTCTGWGGTEMEPGVVPYWTQLNSLKHLIEAGFPAHRCVLRLDPILPYMNGIEAAETVLQYFYSLNLGVHRVRVSVVDDYKHVKQRFRDSGWPTIYPGTNFYASQEQMTAVIQMLARNKKDKIFFETCAESQLARLADSLGYRNLVTEEGCLSLNDLFLMGFEGFSKTSFGINPQNRSGCHCLSCKTELLGRQNKHPCQNKCKYCFWRN